HIEIALLARIGDFRSDPDILATGQLVEALPRIHVHHASAAAKAAAGEATPPSTLESTALESAGRRTATGRTAARLLAHLSQSRTWTEKQRQSTDKKRVSPAHGNHAPSECTNSILSYCTLSSSATLARNSCMLMR